jgi:hypothetical protein
MLIKAFLKGKAFFIIFIWLIDLIFKDAFSIVKKTKIFD